VKSRHRNKAIIGVAGWFGVLLVYVLLFVFCRFEEGQAPVLDGDAVLGLFGVGLVLQYICFFWGGYHLTLAKGYSPMALAPGLIPCLQIVTLIVLLVLPDKNVVGQNQPPKQSRRSRESHIARRVRYRRNALIGNVFGVVGILIGVCMVLFPVGYTDDLDDEVVIGMGVFLAGYVGVITGCWWWAKAKGWPDAIVFIGLLPVGIFFIPWVRLIFLAVPMLLPTLMIMMPIILLVVMAVLPDKSGIQKRHH